MSTVSVVIPCHNGGDLVAEAIDSAWSQTHCPLEVILVDDGSIDGSAERAISSAGPTRLLRQEQQGESVARNHGIDVARGDWVAFLDADDVWLPGSIERRLELASSVSVAVHSDYVEFGTQRSDRVRGCGHIPAEARYDLRRIVREGNPCHPSTMMVRRELPLRFPTWTQYGEDTFYFYELVGAGRIDHVAEVLTRVRMWPGQQSADPSADVNRHLAMEQWLQRNPQGWDTSVVDDIRMIRLRRLLSFARNARTSQPAAFDRMRMYLQQYSAVPEVSQELQSWAILQSEDGA